METEKLEAYNTIAEPVFAPEGTYLIFSYMSITQFNRSDTLVHVCAGCLSHVHVVGAVRGAVQRDRVPEAAGALLPSTSLMQACTCMRICNVYI